MKRSSFLPVIALALTLFTTAAFSQNMATKKIIAKYENDYIPTFKEDLGSLTKDPRLSGIDVKMDFKSFGDDFEELDGAVRQLIHAKGAIVFLAKDDVRKTAIHEGLKTIVVSKVDTPSKKSMSIKDGVLYLATNTYKDSSNLNSSNDIQHFLEKNL